MMVPKVINMKIQNMDVYIVSMIIENDPPIVEVFRTEKDAKDQFMRWIDHLYPEMADDEKIEYADSFECTNDDLFRSIYLDKNTLN